MLEQLFAPLSGTGELILRLTIGLTFLPHGWQKLKGPGGFAVSRRSADFSSDRSADLAAHNNNPEPFKWTATTDHILEKVRRGRVTLNAITD